MSSEPRDIVICCCRDEQDIIYDFVTFYFDLGFDQICLIDNGSRDATRELVCAHPRAQKISLWYDPAPKYDIRLLEHYRRFEYEADRWVFFIDADEFIHIPGGIKGYAARLPPGVNALELSIVDMLPLEPPPSAHPLTTTRRGSIWYDPIKVVWKRQPVHRICCGRHRIETEAYRPFRDERLFIRHYPIRSPEQLRRKLENRLALLTALEPSDIEQLSIFSLRETLGYLEETRQILATDCKQYVCQAARQPSVEDAAIRDWYLSRGL
jgi:hypothetical protein